MNIGIDIDDVIATTMPIFLQRVKKHYGINVPINKLNNFSAKTEDYGYITVDQAKALLARDQQDQVILSLPTYPHVSQVIDHLKKEHKIILITSRNNYDLDLLNQHTRDWLIKNNIHFDEIVFTTNKDVAVKEHEIDLMIDDSLTFIKQVTGQNIRVILFAQPWNKKYPEFLSQKEASLVLGRTDNWLEILNIIEKLNKEVIN